MFLVEPVPAQKSKESSADVILNISGQVWLWMEKALTLWKAWKKNCYFQTLFLYDVGFSSSKMLAFSGCFLSFLWPTEIACQPPAMKSGITIEWIKKAKGVDWLLIRRVSEVAIIWRTKAMYTVHFNWYFKFLAPLF